MTEYRAIYLLALTFYAGNCLAAPSLEDYGLLPKVSRMVISPNGERIAYRNTESDDKDYVVVYSLKDKKYVNLFRVDQIDPRYMKFSGNDHLLLVVTEHVDSRRFVHSFDAGTAYAYDIAKNKVSPLVTLGESLSRGRVVYPGQSIGNIIGSSKDGREVYIGAYVGDSVTDRSPRYSMLRVADGLNWNKVYEYEAEIATHAFLGLTGDYKSLVFLRNDEDQLQYYALSLTTGGVGRCSRI